MVINNERACHYRLEAKAVGVPKPQVRWLKQGVELTHSSEYQIEELPDGTSALTLPQVFCDDAGAVQFEARNSLGAAATVAALRVDSECSPKAPSESPTALICIVSFRSSNQLDYCMYRPCFQFRVLQNTPG